MKYKFALLFSAIFHSALLSALWSWSLQLRDQPVRVRVARGRPISLQASWARPAQQSVSVLPSIDWAPQMAEPAPSPSPAATSVERRTIDHLDDSPATLPAPEAPAVEREAPSPLTPRPLAAPESVVKDLAAPLQRAELTNAPPTMAAPLSRAETAGAAGDEQPRKLPSNSPPSYPLDALLARVEGRVLLRVRVSANGFVAEADVERTSGSTSLDRAALVAVRRWRFEPARRAGRDVAAEVIVPVKFSIQRG